MLILFHFLLNPAKMFLRTLLVVAIGAVFIAGCILFNYKWFSEIFNANGWGGVREFIKTGKDF